MIDITLIVERLKSQVPELVRVAGLADLLAARASITQLPAAYIVPEPESATPSRMIGRHVQKNTVGFAVLLAVKNVSDQTGMAAQMDLVRLSESVRAALLGWECTPDHTPINLTGAGPLDFSQQILYWPERFQASVEISV